MLRSRRGGTRRTSVYPLPPSTSLVRWQLRRRQPLRFAGAAEQRRAAVACCLPQARLGELAGGCETGEESHEESHGPGLTPYQLEVVIDLPKPGLTGKVWVTRQEGPTEMAPGQSLRLGILSRGK